MARIAFGASAIQSDNHASAAGPVVRDGRVAAYAGPNWAAGCGASWKAHARRARSSYRTRPAARAPPAPVTRAWSSLRIVDGKPRQSFRIVLRHLAPSTRPWSLDRSVVSSLARLERLSRRTTAPQHFRIQYGNLKTLSDDYTGPRHTMTVKQLPPRVAAKTGSSGKSAWTTARLRGQETQRRGLCPCLLCGENARLNPRARRPGNRLTILEL